MTRWFHLVRADDLLVMDVELINLDVSPDGQWLIPTPGTYGQVILHLPYQHVREPSDPDNVPLFRVWPKPAVAAWPTDLVASRIGAPLPLAAGLLGAWEQVGEGVEESRLELLTRLRLTTRGGARWSLTPRPLRRWAGAEIWRARWLTRPGDPPGRVLIAEVHGEDPSTWDRPVVPTIDDVARLSKGILTARRLDLSMLGASVDVAGPTDWELGEDVQPTEHTNSLLGSYKHVTGMGRDIHVQMVTRGCLSSGHSAALVAVSSRRFTWQAFSDLHVEYQVLVTQRFLDVGGLHAPFRDGGRGMPLRTLEIDVDRSPVLGGDDWVPPPEGGPFWVSNSAGWYEFPMVATDWAGRTVRFTMPQMFIPEANLGQHSVGLPVPAFNSSRASRRPLGGQMVTVADGGGDAATVPVTSMELELVALPGPPPTGYLPPWVVSVPRFEMVLDSVRELTGYADPVPVVLHDAYRDHGIDGPGNPAKVFLRLENGPLPVGFRPSDVGGLARPDMAIGAVAVGGVLPAGLDVPGPAPDPRAIFGSAKLLGKLPLAELLDRDLLTAPGLQVQPDPAGVRIVYTWQPALRANASVGGLRLDAGARLALNATVVRHIDGRPDETLVKGSLTNLAIVVADVVRVDIQTLTFTSRPGAAPTVECAGLKLTFSNQLEFLNKLRDKLPTTFAGWKVDVGRAGVVVGYSLAVPSVGIGVLSLSNLAVSAQVTIPFDDRPPSLRFAVAERHRPFAIAVSMFGGGGFFALTATTDRLEELEVSLEFGGSFSLNLLGLASGGVYLMAGIYLKRVDAPNPGGPPTSLMKVDGYVRCGGYLSILGLIGISIEFYLALTYEKSHGTTRFGGRASVTVGVQVLFFSRTVTLPFEQHFDGAPGDPSFTDCVDGDDWNEYCLAFAPESS